MIGLGYGDEDDLDYGQDGIDDYAGRETPPPPPSPRVHGTTTGNSFNETSATDTALERKGQEDQSSMGIHRDSSLNSQGGSQFIFPTDPPGSENANPNDPSNSSNPLVETISSLETKVEKMKMDYATALGNITGRTTALQAAISLPDENSDKAAAVAAAHSRLDEANQLHNALKNLYETHRSMLSHRLQDTPVASTAHTGPRDATKAEQRMDLQMQYARSELAKKAPPMYKDHKLRTNDCIAIWAQRLYDCSHREFMNQSMVIAATMAQLSPEVRAQCQHVPESALNHIDKFLDFTFKSQNPWTRYANITALETLFNDCCQLVGPKHSSGGYEYAETFPAFITRVHRLARVLYPRMSREQIGPIVARQVQIGLHPRWREHMFAAASNSSKYNFPKQGLTLSGLDEIAARICTKSDYLGRQPVTLELFPTVCYRAQVLDGEFWIVSKGSHIQPDSHPVKVQSGKRKPQTYNTSSGSSSRSSLEPFPLDPTPLVLKPGVKKTGQLPWEVRKKQKCSFHEAKGVSHLLEACPDRIRTTGKFTEEVAKKLGQKPKGSE